MQSDLGKALDPDAELLLFLRKVHFNVSKPASTAKEYAPFSTVVLKIQPEKYEKTYLN